MVCFCFAVGSLVVFDNILWSFRPSFEPVFLLHWKSKIKYRFVMHTFLWITFINSLFYDSGILIYNIYYCWWLIIFISSLVIFYTELLLFVYNMSAVYGCFFDRTRHHFWIPIYKNLCLPQQVCFMLFSTLTVFYVLILYVISICMCIIVSRFILIIICFSIIFFCLHFFVYYYSVMYEVVLYQDVRQFH